MRETEIVGISILLIMVLLIAMVMLGQTKTTISLTGNLSITSLITSNNATIKGHGITLYNKTDDAWCAFVDGEGNITTIEGSCGG